MSARFIPAGSEYIKSLTNIRTGEVKLGECVSYPVNQDWEAALRMHQGRFVLIGIPEDIGVRANLGMGGTQTLWEPALRAILNTQSTWKLTGRELLLLGHFDFSEWMSGSATASTEELRDMVARIDDMVTSVVIPVIAAGKIPIVVGGGHNNAYPLLKAVSVVAGKAVNCINCDAHSDYRAMEGRHSGNGFRYAKKEGYLKRYAVLGLHENYNSATVLDEMSQDPDIFLTFYEDIFVRRILTFDEAMERLLRRLYDDPAGIELDLDCIEQVLSSASTPSGISTMQARQFIYECCKRLNVAYLHLAEGAVQLSDGRVDMSTTKLVAYIVTDFMKSLASPANGGFGHG